MGTTDPTSAIFLTDTPKEIEEKVFININLG
jgi:tryptophanyl-tRNA synthetase